MGPPSGALRECQPGSPRVAYRHMSNHVHHAQARVGSTRGERDPLQLVVLFALLVMLLICLFHFRSLEIVIPRYLAESVIGKGWSWRVYVLRILCLVRPACMV